MKKTHKYLVVARPAFPKSILFETITFIVEATSKEDAIKKAKQQKRLKELIKVERWSIDSEEIVQEAIDNLKKEGKFAEAKDAEDALNNWKEGDINH